MRRKFAAAIFAEQGFLPEEKSGMKRPEVQPAIVFRLEERFLNASVFKVATELSRNPLFELFVERHDESTEIPVVYLILAKKRHGIEAGVLLVAAQEAFYLVVFIADAPGLASAVDGRGFVVAAIVQKSAVQKEGSVGASQRFEVEGYVLIRCPGGGQKAYVLRIEPGTAKKVRPDVGSLKEDARPFSRHKQRFCVFGRNHVVDRGFPAPIVVEIALHHIDVVFFCSVVERFEHIRVGPVVGLHNADVFSGGGVEGLVHAVAVAGVWLVDDADAGIAGGVLPQNVGGGVGGAVIYADDLHVRQRLVHHGIQTLAEVLLHIIAGHENGYGWHYRCSMSSRARATALSMS